MRLWAFLWQQQTYNLEQACFSSQLLLLRLSLDAGQWPVPTRAHVEVGSGVELLSRTIAESGLYLLPEPSDSESQEEIIQNIARSLARVGDEMDHSIQPTLVRQLASQFMDGRLSEEVSMRLYLLF